MKTLALAAGITLLLAGAAGAATLQSAAKLVRSLGGSGRAEASLRFTVPGAATAGREVRAMLALEPPDRARLDMPASGERIVARADGGEWLQPSAHQLLRFRADQAAPALRWWRVLLGSESTARERAVGPSRYVITLLDEHGAPEDSAEVWLDPRGLPARLVVPAGDPEAMLYRLANWRFVHARGEPAFHHHAPPGYETVDMP